MERTYVFNQEPSSGGGNKFDIMAMLPNLMGGKGVDPNLMALLSQGTTRTNGEAHGGLSGLSCFGSAGAVTDSVSEDVTEEDYRLN